MKKNGPNILIVEDDADQMELLTGIVLGEIQKITDNQNLDEQKKQQVRDIQIIRVRNIDSLKKAASTHKGTILALLDCNIPDTKDSPAHDQLIKTNYKITGQHKSVDIVTQHLPNTPITMISSLNRFQKIVVQYYEKKNNLNLNFISKNDQPMIERNIAYYLRQHIKG